MMPPWWNWQTRSTQNAVSASSCRFDSDRRHHLCGAHTTPRSRTLRVHCGAGKIVWAYAHEGSAPEAHPPLAETLPLGTKKLKLNLNYAYCVLLYLASDFGVAEFNRFHHYNRYYFVHRF